MSETYTLAEAQQELRRRECEQRGHGPDNFQRTFDSTFSRAFCDCGEVSWWPKSSIDNLTAERDQARRIAVALEQEVAELTRRLAEVQS